MELAATCDIDLFVSWTPKAGQDGVLISANLIKLLGEVGAHIAMDTYTDDQESQDGNQGPGTRAGSGPFFIPELAQVGAHLIGGGSRRARR